MKLFKQLLIICLFLAVFETTTTTPTKESVNSKSNVREHAASWPKQQGPLNPIYFLEIPVIPSSFEEQSRSHIEERGSYENDNNNNNVTSTTSMGDGDSVLERSQSKRVIYQQKVGRYDPYSPPEFVVYFHTFEVANTSGISLAQFSSRTLRFYAIQSSTSPPYQNQMFGISVDSLLQPFTEPYCTFDDNYLAQYLIVAFAENNGSAVVLAANGLEVKLFQVELFNTSSTTPFPCTTTELGTFQPSNTTSLQSGLGVGSIVDWQRKRFVALHKTLGVVVLNFSDPNSTNSWIFPLANATSLATSIDPSGNIFLVAPRNVSNVVSTYVVRVNVTSGAITTVKQLEAGGLLGYDPNYSQGVVAAGTTLYIYGNTNVKWQLKTPWRRLYYYSGPPPQYCPNYCHGAQGDCVDNMFCRCYFGWMADDCHLCDSNTFCHNQGTCVVAGGNRTCNCYPGWVPPNCGDCDTIHFCNGHGSCDSTANGACTCYRGFGGTSCSQCDSDILCSGRGQCLTNNTSTGSKVDPVDCICHDYWQGSDCSDFEIPDQGVVSAILVLNSMTLIGWLVMLVLAIIGVLLESTTYGARFNQYVSLEGVQMALLYFQSFTLILSNPKLFSIGHRNFKRFYLLTLDVASFQDSSDESVWIESSLFLPKCIIFVCGAILFYLIKHPRIRGLMLQFAMLFYFLFIVSLFERFDEDKCSQCTAKYNIPATLLALIFLCVLVYLQYRLWKVLAANKHYFESTDYEMIGTSQRIYFSSQQYARIIYRILTFVFLPWSEFVSFMFIRLCEVDPAKQAATTNTGLPAPSIHGLPNAPPLSPPIETAKKKMEYQPESSVQEFVTAVAKKIDHDDPESIEKIVAMLKGNWYTTVADLRTLSESDAEKLNIPQRLFRAMQKELPREESPDAYTALHSLVHSVEKDRFVSCYGWMADPYTVNHYLFRLDYLLARNTMWALLAIALWRKPSYQLIVMLIYQIWYTLFILWHKPYKNVTLLVMDLFSQAALVLVIVMLFDLAYFYSHYYLFVMISMTHLLVMLVCTCTKGFYHLYHNIVDPVDAPEDDETSHLIAHLNR